jgi:hypothetical protein
MWHFRSKAIKVIDIVEIDIVEIELHFFILNHWRS